MTFLTVLYCLAVLVAIFCLLIPFIDLAVKGIRSFMLNCEREEMAARSRAEREDALAAERTGGNHVGL